MLNSIAGVRVPSLRAINQCTRGVDKALATMTRSAKGIGCDECDPHCFGADTSEVEDRMNELTDALLDYDEAIDSVIEHVHKLDRTIEDICAMAPYHFFVPADPEMSTWVAENVIRDHRIWTFPSTFIVIFTHADDAALFKMRWV